ncbi:MAG: LysR family transcriptional regulator [Tardiphaga sp.]|jgi:LysR family transcriptional regulator of beta-lactamase|nr:LysR family transcriptional regulator [Tardiphaga sp.]
MKVKSSHLPLNALRAFEASARQLSFTRAGLELRVTQAAVSHQVKSLEEHLGVQLFRRLPRGLALTDEGQALLPAISASFDRMRATLDRFEGGHFREVITVGVVGTFATGWLLSRLKAFERSHPYIDLRLLTNNNRVDIAGEGLDFAIRFGDGLWHGTEATRLFAAPLTPMCAAKIASRLRRPTDLKRETLLRSYRQDEWHRWFTEAGIAVPAIKGVIFDSSVTMAEVAARGGGVALLPACMFSHEMQAGRLVQPFKVEIVLGAYWLTSLRSKRPSAAMQAFKTWLLDSAAGKGRPPT